MDYFKKAVSGALGKPLKGKLSEEEIASIIEVPPERKMGDYAFPCFKLAPILKKKPQEIAFELGKSIKLPSEIEKAEVKGAYLNFFVNKSAFAEKTLSKILSEKEKFGSSNKGKGHKIMVESCQANTHKAFHIGYVRNICIGECMARLFEFNGYKVVRANFQGDVGPHISKCLWAYENFYKGKEKTISYDKGKWLGEIYTFANKKIEEDYKKEELEQKMRDMVNVIYKKSDKNLVELWKETRKWSLDYFGKIYAQLGIKFDKLYFEGDLDAEGIKIVRGLQKEKLIEESEGALVMNLEKYDLGNFILLKSDGMALYSTKDLALAEAKLADYKIEKTYNVVGDEQDFYFRQLIKTLEILAEKSKFKFATTEHISYALVNLKEGKMSSRAGTVVLYDDLFEKMQSSTFSETKKRHPEWTENKILETARELALAAIKFGMLNRDNTKTIVFDWEDSLRFEGETGPYLLYTYARARSILRKSHDEDFKKADFSKLNSEQEQNIISILGCFEEALEKTLSSKSPHHLSQYLIELSTAFNSFYHSNPVIQSEKSLRNARLALVCAVSIILKTGLELLNIKALEEM